MSENSFICYQERKSITLENFKTQAVTAGSVEARFNYTLSKCTYLLGEKTLSQPICVSGSLFGSRPHDVLIHRVLLDKLTALSISLTGTVVARKRNISLPAAIYEIGSAGLSMYQHKKTIAGNIQDIFNITLDENQARVLEENGLKLLLTIAGFQEILYLLEESFKEDIISLKDSSANPTLQIRSPLIKFYPPLPLFEGVLAKHGFTKTGDLYLKGGVILEQILAKKTSDTPNSKSH